MPEIEFRRKSFTIKAGDRMVVSEDEAARLVRNGHAFYVADTELALEVDLGTVAGVLEQVGDDKAKAQAALDAEQAKGDGARVTLVSALETIING